MGGGTGCFRQASESRTLAHRQILPLHYHGPQTYAVKTVSGLDSGVKSKQNQSHLPLCMLAGQEKGSQENTHSKVTICLIFTSFMPPSNYHL